MNIETIQKNLQKLFNDKIECVIVKGNRLEILFEKEIVDDNFNINLDIKKRTYNKQEYVEFFPIEGEEWRELEEFPNVKISNLGRIIKKGKLLKLVKDKSGYIKVNITDKNHKGKNIGVHRLVAKAFIPNTENKSEVAHINTIRSDNRVENLRWVTPFENMFENNITFERIKNKGDRFLLETLKTTLKREK